MRGQIVLRRAVEKKLGRVGDGCVDNGVYRTLYGGGNLCWAPLFVFHQFGRVGYSGLMKRLKEGFCLEAMNNDFHQFSMC